MPQVSKTQPGEWAIEPLLVGEFEVTRPTPSQAENDLLGATPGAVTPLKRWDLSPVDQSSFDPTEPPGRPAPLEAEPIRFPRLNKSAPVPNLRMPFGGEFEVTRPTPLQSENDLLGTTAGDVTMLKIWDLSPVDQQSFDPTEPPGRPLGPPTNTVPPSITLLGTLEVGQQLVCSNGTWTGAPTFTRQWASGGNAIGGATGPTYTIAPADVGAMILCRLTGTNGGGALAVDTAPVGPAVPARPTNTTAPVATAPNGAIVGQAVQTTNGAWTGSPTYAVQWRRGAANIAGATNNLYTLQAADAGQNVGSRITASNASGYPVTADSNTLAVTTLAADEPGDEPAPQPTRPQRPRK